MQFNEIKYDTKIEAADVNIIITIRVYKRFELKRGNNYFSFFSLIFLDETIKSNTKSVNPIH